MIKKQTKRYYDPPKKDYRWSDTEKHSDNPFGQELKIDAATFAPLKKLEFKSSPTMLRSSPLTIAQGKSMDEQLNDIGDRQRKLSEELEKAGYDQTQFKKDDQKFKNIKKQWEPILKLIPAFNQ